jgi:putative transposase
VILQETCESQLKENHAMTTAHFIDPETFLADQLAAASPDLLRSMLSTFVQVLMGAQADAVCGAGYGERSEDRANSRNGYRHRDFDTRAGTIDVAIPKLRAGGSRTNRRLDWRFVARLVIG